MLIGKDQVWELEIIERSPDSEPVASIFTAENSLGQDQMHRKRPTGSKNATLDTEHKNPADTWCGSNNRTWNLGKDPSNKLYCST